MTCLVADPFFKQHLTSAGHPESPARFDAIINALVPLGFPILKPRDATEEEILFCHTKDYFDTVIRDVQECEFSEIKDGSFTLSTGDVQICPISFKVALRAAGSVLTALDAVFEGKAKNAFCIVRPPGHHACSNQGMGFCLFNNVAIGARYAQKKHGVRKVLIVDWDVHHGNGTQEIFEEDPTVFYFSTHQWPLYPGTGTEMERGIGEAKGTILNCPISPGKNSRLDVLEAFRDKLTPAMETFRPELVMISAGFDAHILDPLGGFNLTEQDFAELTHLIKSIAKTYAHERIVSALEGGYNLLAIAAASKAHVMALEQ